MKLYVTLSLASSARDVIREDDLIFKTLGESCYSGWHKFEADSAIVESIYKISFERGVEIGAYFSPVFTKKELNSFTHFVPNFKEVGMTDPQLDKFLSSVRSCKLIDLGGIGKIALPEQATLRSPVKIDMRDIKRITYHSEELIATARYISKLNDHGADLSDGVFVGNSVCGTEVFMLRTQNFTPSVVMNETITDRLGLNDEAAEVENRYYQSGSRCYNDLSPLGLISRTIDSLSMQLSPPWIINQTMLEIIKVDSIWCRLDPVFQIGTPICDEYLLKWRRLIELAFLTPRNYIKFG